MRCLKCSIPLMPKNGIPLTMKICPSCEQNLPSLVNTLARGTKLAQGKYQIEYVLGKGGFGITYYAVGIDKKQYIIKEYCPSENVVRSKTGGLTASRYVSEFEQGKNKFIYEAKILSKFRDNIAHTIHWFEENNTAYMVTEFVEGKRLTQELKEFPTGFIPSKVTEIVDVLVKVLNTVHAEGLYHLDIKPENIIRTDDGSIVLVDFGSCRQVKFGSKSLRTFDPRYAPPELISANGTVGAYSDVFELGMLLHTLLVGKPPASSFERFFDPKNDPIDPSLSSDWDSLIRSVIALQPFDRPQSVAEWWGQRKGGEGERGKEGEQGKEGAKGRGGAEKKGRLPFEFKTARVKLVGTKIEITEIPGEATYVVENLGHGVTLDMVYVPGGHFHMGSGKNSAESPQHTVDVPAFYLSKYPITQAQYLQIVGKHYSNFIGFQHPVEEVSWLDAQEFCKKLNERTKEAYSLPSEAQWEYACRANTQSTFYFGEKISSDLANYDASSTSDIYGIRGKGRKTTTVVGTFPPNSFGLYDLYGNVWEWCLDTWHANYDKAPNDGSAWVDKIDHNYRVVRGGSWSDDPASCHTANRHKYAPDTKANNIGFRIALLA
jgi:eukaryotic-like serine/threonine-protein kinase